MDGLSQELKLEQRQVISLRLQQALQMLTLNTVELADRVQEELELNPALELDQGEGAAIPLSDGDLGPKIADVDWSDYFDGATGPFIRETDEPYDPLANRPAGDVSLTEHLVRQLEVICDDEEVFETAVGIVSAIDNDGYLTISAEELAAELGKYPEEVERVLTEVIHELDPPGVGARDLRECLLVQWRLTRDRDPLAGRIIAEALADIAKKGPAFVAAEFGASVEDVAGAIELIRSMEPRPGRAFGATRNTPVVPDITVELVEGEVLVRVEDDAGGRLYISPKYKNLLLNQKNLDAKTKKYLQERIRAAAWFIRAVHQRRRTVRKVAEAVFSYQRDFLERGPLGLKPLTMEEVADDVGVHVSTVSRAAAGKAVDTPRGIYPFKYFFTGGVRGDRGEVAAEKVKVILNDIIDEEDPAAPYSDEALAGKLAEKGIYIARRTVAKYRNEMNIPPKHERQKLL